MNGEPLRYLSHPQPLGIGVVHRFVAEVVYLLGLTAIITAEIIGKERRSREVFKRRESGGAIVPEI